MLIRTLFCFMDTIECKSDFKLYCGFILDENTADLISMLYDLVFILMSVAKVTKNSISEVILLD